ncbi:DHA2 family efflux MFS transporter permease subunit [Amycolatopsis acidicola]|uniref:DHA2 family efflux MFS transporter permease subunit n=1 Tax=Amycolatopsis acidicola TaxID=2596893 RepID=A0A5N0UXC1_9PSEU|nr:DHA2 family efflux MFS transporter permease subunit [Amycolatopsis acidicola]KAA9157605.1 DHA2 family efflux MFS transporter permease subunit [Amycolatopsis acidicola]
MDHRQRWVLALTSLASLMVMLDMLVVTTALNAIRLDLHAGLAELEWTVNAYTLSFAVLLMTAAALGDRFGRRRLFVIGLAVFTVASAGCAVAPGAGLLITGRAIQGAASAMVMPLAFSLLSAAFPPAQRGKALGLFSGVSGLATLGGPLVGGAIVQGLAWQWIFWLNVPIGLLLIPLARTRIPESRGAAARLDFGGLLLAGVGALGIVWALVHANTDGWGTPGVLVPLIAGAVCVAGFVEWERRVPEPMLPMRLFTSRAFAAGNFAGFLLYASIFGSAFFFAQFFQAGLRYSPLEAGLALVPWTVTLSLVAPIAGARMNRIGERRLLVAGMTLQAAGFGWIALVASTTTAYVSLVPPMVLAGVGVSMAMPAAQNAVIGAVPPPMIGKASGTFNTLRQLGGTFGVVILSAVFTSAGGFGSATDFGHGFARAIAVGAGLSLAAAIVGLWIPVRSDQSVPVRRATVEAR